MDSWWNLFDILFISTYLAYLPVSLLYELNDQRVKVAQCLIILLSFIKMTFFLRIFEGFSFLV